MIKLGIYCKDAHNKKEIKKSIKKYFDDLKFESQISFIRTKYRALNNFISNFSEYDITLICEENIITFIKRHSINRYLGYSSQIVGWTDYPITDEKIDKIIIDQDVSGCPNKVFVINNQKTVSAIHHGEIEFFHRQGSKTIIHLNNNQTEEIYQSVKTIKNNLQADYFYGSIKGYLVNLYNIKKIDRHDFMLIMKSGYKIPICKKKQKNLISWFLKILVGL